MVIVEAETVVRRTASVISVRTQCYKYVTETMTCSKVRAVQHTFYNHTTTLNVNIIDFDIASLQVQFFRGAAICNKTSAR